MAQYVCGKCGVMLHDPEGNICISCGSEMYNSKKKQEEDLNKPIIAKYSCRSCGVETNGKIQQNWAMFAVFFVLGLIIPLWMITLPLCWILAFVYLNKGKTVCHSCSSRNVSMEMRVIC